MSIWGVVDLSDVKKKGQKCCFTLSKNATAFFGLNAGF
jgi:hypothetical protein